MFVLAVSVEDVPCHGGCKHNKQDSNRCCEYGDYPMEKKFCHAHSIALCVEGAMVWERNGVFRLAIFENCGEGRMGTQYLKTVVDGNPTAII